MYISGRFNRTVAGATISGALLTGILGTTISWHTARSLNGLVATAEERSEGRNPTFESARVDCVGRVASTMATTHETLLEEHEARVEAENFGTNLERTAKDYTHVIRQCASGELNERMTPSSESEALQTLAKEFNDMVADFEVLADDLSQLVNEVATSREMALETADDRSSLGSETTLLHDLSDDVRAQTDDLDIAVAQINQLSTAIVEIADSVGEVERMSEKTVQIGNGGRESAIAAVEGINNIESESEETVEAIESLQTEVEQIDDLIYFISEIAEQTNILALNAHIEASRAGEQGAGFAAVADEIKELAERTKEAADDIEERLKRIQRQTNQSVKEVQETSDRIAKQADSVENAEEALTDIVSYANETNADISEIHEMAQEQVDTATEARQIIEVVADTSEDIAAEVEALITAAESQTASHTQDPHSRSDLLHQTERLCEDLEPFMNARTSPDDDGGTESTMWVESSPADVLNDTNTEQEAEAKKSEPDGGGPAETGDNDEGR